MNNNTTKKPETHAENSYLILGRLAGRLLVFLGAIIYYLNCILIHIFYTLAVQFPEQQDIHYTEGLFTYREVARKHYQIGVITDSNTDFFSCRSSYFAPDFCEIDKKHYKQLDDELKRNNKRTNIIFEPKIYQKWQGKQAKIGWFRQRYSLFSTDKRVVQVLIDGKEVVSKENVNKHIIRSKKSWIFDLIMSFPLLAFTSYLTLTLILNKDNKHDNLIKKGL